MHAFTTRLRYVTYINIGLEACVPYNRPISVYNVVDYSLLEDHI